MASLAGSALWYAQQGVRVFPLQPGSKVPYGGTRGVKDATTDTEQVRAWWAKAPYSNIGIATGHGFDVLDIDDWERAGVDETVNRICDEAGFAFAATPRGTHVYVPSDGDGNKAKCFPGCDWRGLGGYVVAPPSRLPTGDYLWLRPVDFAGRVK